MYIYIYIYIYIYTYAYMKSDTTPCMIYADFESLNNPGKPSTIKIGEKIHCRYSITTIWAFDNIENKHSLQVMYFSERICSQCN